jgi:hypothetical protein
LYPIDFVAVKFESQKRIIDEAACFYEKGWSLREIARELGCSKNKVRKCLLKNGHELREPFAQATHLRGPKHGKQCARPYYGFCYFEGEIIKDPREFPTLQVIHRRWCEKKTIHQITQELNRTKLPSRSGKTWSWAAVQNLIVRFDTKKVILHTGGKYEFR